MNELQNELIIEIFEKIDLKETSLFIDLSKTNKRFYFIYKGFLKKKLKSIFLFNSGSTGILVLLFHLLLLNMVALTFLNQVIECKLLIM